MAGSARRPALIIFDVNETLSDMTPLAVGFADLGLEEKLRNLVR